MIGWRPLNTAKCRLDSIDSVDSSVLLSVCMVVCLMADVILCTAGVVYSQSTLVCCSGNGTSSSAVLSQSSSCRANLRITWVRLHNNNNAQSQTTALSANKLHWYSLRHLVQHCILILAVLGRPQNFFTGRQIRRWESWWGLGAKPPRNWRHVLNIIFINTSFTETFESIN